MGNNIPLSMVVNYKTKEGIEIQYLIHDLKGHTRYPHPPADNEVMSMFNYCVDSIVLTPQQLSIFKDFNCKYKFRFVILHRRKLQEAIERYELNELRHSGALNYVKKDAEDIRFLLTSKLNALEYNEGALKVGLPQLMRAIKSREAIKYFMEVQGLTTIVGLLSKQIGKNKDQLHHNFGGQVYILRFVRQLAESFRYEFYKWVGGANDYALNLLRAYHEVNTGVTVQVLWLLYDYVWNYHTGEPLLDAMGRMQRERTQPSILTPFVTALETTDNIIMLYYNLHFLNELYSSVVAPAEKELLHHSMEVEKYEIILYSLKHRLASEDYRIESCTLLSVFQKSLNFVKKEPRKNNLASTRMSMGMGDLQQALLTKIMLEGYEKEEIKFIYGPTLYLDYSCRKEFRRFMLDSYTQLQNYYSLRSYFSYDFNEKHNVSDLTVVHYQHNQFDSYTSLRIYRLKTHCIKSNAQPLLLSVLQNMSHLYKSQFHKLNQFLSDYLTINKKESVDYIGILKTQLYYKYVLVKRLLKSLNYVKGSNINCVGNTSLSSSPPSLAIVNSNPLSLPSTMHSSSNELILLPHYIGSTTLPPLPNGLSILTPNGLPILPPPPNGLPILPPPPNGLPILPPPPNGLPILPPPPNGLPILPPPPNGLPLLPPPPNGLPLLPPPNGLPILPPSPNGLPLLPASGLGLPNLPPLPNGLPLLNIPSNGLPTLSLLGGPKYPTKAKRESKVALKTCSIAVLPWSKIMNTVWYGVDDLNLALEEDELCALFCKAPVAETQKIEEKVAKVVRKEPVRLLGSDRWRNMYIVLTQLKVPNGCLRQALKECTGKYCTQSIVEAFSKLMPSEEEEQCIKNFYGATEDLGRPYQFLQEMISIECYESRIRCLIFANIKEYMYYELGSKIEQLKSGFQGLRNNERLKYALEVGLAVGNYLNGSTSKGGAWGFKVDSIERMNDVKSADGKMTAGVFLVKEVCRKYSSPLFDRAELYMYQYLSQMPTSQLSIELGELRRYLAHLKKASASYNQQDPNDSIHVFCEDMLTEAAFKLASFEEAVASVDKIYKETATYFCEDPLKSPSDEVGKRILKTILFLVNNYKILEMMEEKKKKEEQRFIGKNYNKSAGKQYNKPLISQKSYSKKAYPTLPCNPYIKHTKSEDAKKPEFIYKYQLLKELEKNQEEREKKFLEDMMKKRYSKITALRQSKMPKMGKIDIDFLKEVGPK